MNRMHKSHLLEEKGREFDIVNLQRYDSSRNDKFSGKELNPSTWDKLTSNPHIPIKSGGFL